MKGRRTVASKQLLIPAERIEQKILFLRGEKLMLSTDLARLYGVEPRTLIQAVKRNRQRFPPDQGRVRKLEITDCDFEF